MTGVYYYSDVTSFLYKMRSLMPSKAALVQAYNQKYTGLAAQMNLLEFARRHVTGYQYSLSTPKNTPKSQDRAEGDLDGINDSQMATNVHALQSVQASSESADIELTSNYTELRALRKQVCNDLKTSAVSGAEQAGQKYLDLIFRDKRVHRASLDMINKAIRDPTFLSESRDYGIKLINEVVKDRKFQQEIKKSSIEIINHDDIKKTSIDIIQHVVTHPTTRSNVINLMIEVLTQTDAKDVMIDALAESTLSAVQEDETTGVIGTLFNKTIANKQVQEEAMSAIVHRNLYDLVTFKSTGNSFNNSSKSMDLVE